MYCIQMKRIEYFKVVLILPFNVLITIPLLIFFLTRKNFHYDIIRFNNIIFYISLAFLILGAWLAFWSVRTFYIKGGDGTPGPWKPINNLIISGPYKFVRNPMLIGVFFLILFESIFFNSILIFFWFIIFFITNIIYFKIYEEKELIKRFGSDYKDYKNKVPMLFPNFKPYSRK